MYFDPSVRIADLVGISLLVIAIVTITSTMLQLRENTKTRRAEFIRLMFLPAITDRDFLRGFYLVSHKRFVFNEDDFPLTDEEMQIDRVLGHLSLLCYFHKLGLLRPDEVDFYGFIIRAFGKNEQIQRYMLYVYEKSDLMSCTINPYQSFIDYCEQIHVLPQPFIDSCNKMKTKLKSSG